MKKSPPLSFDARVLRQQAQQKLREQQKEAKLPLSQADAQALVHELQVHQLELEMQNEELNHAEAEAKQAADNYADLFDFAPLGYYVIASNGLIREVNLAGAALVGFGRQQVAGQKFEQYLVPDCRVAFGEFWRGLLARESRIPCEVRLLQHNHDPRDVHVEGSPLESVPGQELRCLLALTDITERRHAEQKLLQLNAELEKRVAERTTELQQANAVLGASEQRYRLLFQNLQEGFYLGEAILDAAGKCCDAVYLEVNPALEQIMGRPRDQIVGKRVKELVPQVKPEWLEVFGKVTRTGEPMMYEDYSVMFEKHFEAFVFRPLPGQFGVLVTDVTERKRAEEALQAKNRELERFNRVMVGRELRLVELKKEVNELCREAGRPRRYSVNPGMKQETSEPAS